jgi:hypothetical protein
MILLHVSPTVSQHRRPADNAAILTRKALAMEAMGSDGFGLTVIQAEQPLEDVLVQVKQVVWKLL